jgi:hypothetical protein
MTVLNVELLEVLEVVDTTIATGNKQYKKININSIQTVPNV